MRWAGLYLVLFAVLLFVSPCFIYSDVTLTDQEWTELLNGRENSKTALTIQNEDFQKTLDQLETDHQNDLTQLENRYNQEIALLRIESEVRIKSLMTLKKEMIWNNVKWFIAGLGLGFAGGEAVGIRIGITL